jgi:Fic family protein
MHVPANPPNFAELHRNTSPDTLVRALEATRSSLSGPYFHWDELRHREPPEGLSHHEWWHALKTLRLIAARPLPLTDATGNPFTYSLPDVALQGFHKLDQLAAGRLAMDERVTNPSLRDRYIVSSLMEEAITSSQLEGASTSRQVAREMLRSGRRPRTKSEQMILNNYLAMDYIRERRQEQLTPELVRELHSVVVEATLDDPRAAGKLQLPGEARVQVWGPEGELLHTPPPAEQLPERLAALCRFANGEPTGAFLPPAARAILVHFWLAYDHPFVDGNGRTARALFYWTMLSQDYWLAEFLTISRILRDAPARYARSFLYTETDDRDATYFIVYQLEVVLRAIDELGRYLRRKVAEVSELESLLRSSAPFNHRQLALLSHALRRPDAVYTFDSHRRSHNVTYQTARTDLLNLEARGLLVRRNAGRAHHFVPVNDLPARLRGR